MIKNYPGEVWKDFIVDKKKSKRSYSMSNYGRAMSYMHDPEKDGRLISMRLVDGYPAVSYRRRQPEDFVRPTTTTRFVHKLVAILFIGDAPTPAHKHVIHLDYNKENNKVQNLKWATKQEVEKHLEKNPHYIEAKKKQKQSPEKYASKLSRNDVIRLKKKIFDPKRKTRLKIIAKQFNISEMQLHRIKSGENWATVTIPEELEYRKRKAKSK